MESSLRELSTPLRMTEPLVKARRVLSSRSSTAAQQVPAAGSCIAVGVPAAHIAVAAAVAARTAGAVAVAARK